MKPVLFRVTFLAAAAASVGAQTTDTDDSTSTSTTACAAQNILDTCLSTTESYVSLCATTDYMSVSTTVPTTAGRRAINNRKIFIGKSPSALRKQRDEVLLFITSSPYSILNCLTLRADSMNASLYATTSGNRTVSRSITSTSSSETTTTSEGLVKTADVTTAASTPTPTEPTQSGNNAGERVIHAGGRLAALAGIIAYFL
ncbi:hypothetical protein Daesc_007336 [Daldinia eschscholtzii]|uniref:Uncharacterized protein n=1 Tax=Daldinia eschscholtzii TaxID=292717 RepID=A0AAX6MF44_9PEZI